MQTTPKFGLERMRALLDALGRPEERLRAIHVAGTKGKGSTCAFVDAILAAAGIRRGLTTSPHLSSARERVMIDGALISEDAFVAAEAQVAAAADVVQGATGEAATFFERMIALALVAFVDASVDVAVVEVGLGGRLDATNLVRPIVTGVSRLGIDHVQYLGDTIALIAGEKAGIFKRGVPAVSSPQEPAAAAVLVDVAAGQGAPLAFVDAPWPGPCGLAGAHQRENAALAAALVRAAGLPVDDAAIAQGIARATWPGRYERMAPTILLDGAHNPLAAEALAATLAADPTLAGNRVVLVVGATAGHDPEAFARAFLRTVRPARVVATQSRSPRSLTAAEVAAGWRAALDDGVEVVVEPDILAALLAARGVAGAAVVVTGSLYVVGEARAALVPGTPVDPALPSF